MGDANNEIVNLVELRLFQTCPDAIVNRERSGKYSRSLNSSLSKIVSVLHGRREHRCFFLSFIGTLTIWANPHRNSLLCV